MGPLQKLEHPRSTLQLLRTGSSCRCLISIAVLVTGCKPTGRAFRTITCSDCQLPSLEFGLLSSSIHIVPHTILASTSRSTDPWIPYCLSEHYDKLLPKRTHCVCKSLTTLGTHGSSSALHPPGRCRLSTSAPSLTRGPLQRHGCRLIWGGRSIQLAHRCSDTHCSKRRIIASFGMRAIIIS